MSFAGFNQTPATVGYYPNARRDIWPQSPGLDFSGQSRGDNDLSGWFRVLQCDLNASGNVASYAVDFMQYDELATYAWNYGSLRYNSDIPITPIPEPTTSTLLLLGMLVIGSYRRR